MMTIKKGFFMLAAFMSVSVAAQQGFKINYVNLCKEDTKVNDMEVFDCKESKMEMDIEVYRKEGTLYLGGKQTGTKYLIQPEYFEEREDGTLLMILTDAKNGKSFLGKVDFKNKMAGFLGRGGYIFLFGPKGLRYDKYLFEMSREFMKIK